ncbi:hypothetical protein [Rhodococcus opacus]|uniref:hypothetical protein n=1 Tax=Rhodococcus opacus TaxID=37919 RepID=UPI001F54330D|nr:hypothetical protein [Rhodococcus opacus]
MFVSFVMWRSSATARSAMTTTLCAARGRRFSISDRSVCDDPSSRIDATGFQIGTRAVRHLLPGVSPIVSSAADGRRIAHRFSAFDGLSPEQGREHAIGVTLSPVCGGRQSSRRRTALLTVLGVIAAERMVLQFGHTNAVGDVHETLPAEVGADALAPRPSVRRCQLAGIAAGPRPGTVTTSAVSPMPVRNSTCVLRV